jgi:hypothetical protein
MAFLVYTPDAVYDDGGAVEREIAGHDVDLRIEKWNGQDAMNPELLEQADGLLVWQMVTLDEKTIGRLKRCRIIVRLPRREASRSAILRTMAPTKWRITQSP